MYMEYIPVIGNCEDECNISDTGVMEDRRLLGGGETSNSVALPKLNLRSRSAR